MTAQRARRRDLVRDAVIGRILDGTYPPGTRLKELALAAEFGVSQAPVREALREIEVAGLAVSEPYCGTRVLGLEAAELRAACTLKGVIELRAAEPAVPCPQEVLDTLQAIVERLQEAAPNLDFEAYSLAALAFHRGIVVLSRSRTFCMRASAGPAPWKAAAFRGAICRSFTHFNCAARRSRGDHRRYSWQKWIEATDRSYCASLPGRSVYCRSDKPGGRFATQARATIQKIRAHKGR